MGLSGPKRRTKISNDPNNLAWANSTNTFGHKILASKGWKPGDYLGAKDAAHAEHYTAANASSIRVTLRADNLGLGAQIGKANAETFGLSMFSGLLGRLNGKSDNELRAQHSAQRDVELRMYQAQKYGTMNFVYGGLLIGDKIEERELKQKSLIAMPIESREAPEAESRKRKTREDEVEDADVSAKKKRSKKEKKSQNPENREESVVDGSMEPELSLARTKKERDGSKKAEKAKALESGLGGQPGTEVSKAKKKQSREEKAGKSAASDGEKVRLKEEKRARKEERRKRKEEKRRRKAEKKALKADARESSSTSASEDESPAAPPALPQVVLASGNRHAVRQRYIQQKRMASLNPQALKEIFMLQAAS